MDKNRLSQEAPAGVHSTGNRQLLLARSFLLVLFLAFSLASLQPGTPARADNQQLRGDKTSITSMQSEAFEPDCSHCEWAYVQCLASGGGVICSIQYNACIDECLDEGIVRPQ